MPRRWRATKTNARGKGTDMDINSPLYLPPYDRHLMAIIAVVLIVCYIGWCCACKAPTIKDDSNTQPNKDES